MGIQTISTLYETVHCLKHKQMRLKGDKIVNAALDSAIRRESECTRKGSTAVRAQEVHSWAMTKNIMDDEIPAFPVAVWTKEAGKQASQIRICQS